MKFFLVIEKNKLFTFEKNGQNLVLRNIEGSEYFTLNTGSISEDVKMYLDCLANETNLDTIAKLEFDVLESADEICNTAVLSVLEGCAGKVYKLNDLLYNVMEKLSKDKKLYTDKYGINYGGKSYKIVKGKIEQDDFDLVAYTVHCPELADFIEW